ncbi:hypothetical protein HK104_007621 [Borealophlyctis nickersoniae]|nr:hypothetical protein HK104_007621 [Borealophlyctis nickersoniae]
MFTERMSKFGTFSFIKCERDRRYQDNRKFGQVLYHNVNSALAAVDGLPGWYGCAVDCPALHGRAAWGSGRSFCSSSPPAPKTVPTARAFGYPHTNKTAGLNIVEQFGHQEENGTKNTGPGASRPRHDVLRRKSDTKVQIEISPSADTCSTLRHMRSERDVDLARNQASAEAESPGSACDDLRNCISWPHLPSLPLLDTGGEDISLLNALYLPHRDIEISPSAETCSTTGSERDVDLAQNQPSS